MKYLDEAEVKAGDTVIGRSLEGQAIAGPIVLNQPNQDGETYFEVLHHGLPVIADSEDCLEIIRVMEYIEKAELKIDELSSRIIQLMTPQQQQQQQQQSPPPAAEPVADTPPPDGTDSGTAVKEATSTGTDTQQS